MKKSSPNDFGKKHLVEECQKLKISEFLKEWQERFKEQFIKASIVAYAMMAKSDIRKSLFIKLPPLCWSFLSRIGLDNQRDID